MKSIACPVCRTAASPVQRFCSHCGAGLSATLDPSLSGDEGQHLRRRLGGTTWVAPGSDAGPSQPVVAATAASSRRRKHRKSRLRKKRYLLPMVALLLLTVGVGAAAYRAESTVNRLQRVSTLPEKITVAEQPGDPVTSTGLVIDTAPAEAALIAAGIEPGGADIGGFRDRASNLGGLAEGAAVAAGVRDPSTDALTILIMGVDARPGAPIDIAVRPDALMVLRLDPVARSCRILAIPRDTLAELPGYGPTKINYALMVGGVPYQRLVVEQLLGITLDRYALIDFVGFKEMVEAVGGVPVAVPAEIREGETVLFPAGTSVFDGEQALAYARYRGGLDVDVGRVRRQQQIIRSLATVAGSRDIVRDVSDLLPAFEDHIRTDLAPSELAELGKEYTRSCGESRLQLDSLQGKAAFGEQPDPIFNARLSYNIVDPAVLAGKVAVLMGRDPAAS